MGNLSAKGVAPPDVPDTLPTQRWELVSRPNGLVSLDNFELRDEQLKTALQDGEALVETEMLSVDAFLRTMLDEGAYHGSIPLGSTVPALGYGTVLASTTPRLKVGSRVMGMLGAASVVKMSREQAAQAMPMLSLPGVHPSTFLGLLGLTSGITAWVGIHSVAKPPRKGQTAVISGAAGATGSVAAQLARRTGAKVVGIAGGSAKQRYLLDELGLHGAVDYKGAKSIGDQLDELCPEGVDFYFDTVGGETLDCVLARIRKGGRVVVCGASSQYNGNLNVGTVEGPSSYLKLAERGAMMVGYNVMSYFSRVPLAMLHLLWLRWRGLIFQTQQVEDGVSAFAPAMVKMFTGGHFGKLLVKVAPAAQAVPRVDETPGAESKVKES